MRKILLLATCIAITAQAQTVPPLAATDGTSAAVLTAGDIQRTIAAQQQGTAPDAANAGSDTLTTVQAKKNSTASSDGIFSQRFNLPGQGRNGDFLAYCGGDVQKPDLVDPPYQGVRCQIDVAVSGKLAQKRPADCGVAWVATLILPAPGGEADIRWECRGDTDMGDAPAEFADGQSIHGEAWQCERQADSLTCRNEDQHGFTVGSQKVTIF